VIEYRVENWREYYPEASQIFPIHYEELSIDKVKISMSPDCERYQQMSDVGALHIVTARDDGKLVGYFVWFVFGHMHYKDAGAMAYIDMYYLLPEYRVGGIGAKLIILSESTLKQRGVSKIYLSCKLHQDHDQLFQALGFKPTDRLYTKVLI
jgi:GNAT superfamily N-acetyltransferase